MRRCLLIVLLLWLPLQFSWAAAAGYCQHEQRSGSAHFGHHAHQHDEGEPAPSASELPAQQTPEADHAPSVKDLDCSACQSSCAQPLLPASFDCHVDAAPNTLSPTVAQGHSLPVPALIERPKWTPAA